MKYEDYVATSYEPGKNDLVCEFFVEPVGNINKAAGAVAAESSVGTWTSVETEKSYMKGLSAKVFEIKDRNIKIAYPLQLFEEGNMPSILSSIAGNIFGMKEVKQLKLLDIHFPNKLIKSFKGPKYGIPGVRKLLKVYDRPLLGTIVKPKLGLNSTDHSKVAYDAWVGGIDIVKDDENLTNQNFNRFKERLIKTFRMKEKAENETGEKKIYMINVSAETEEMLKRAKLVENIGNEYVMVDIIVVGWSALQTLRDQDFKLVLHAHRAGHAAFTRSPHHGISMKVISKVTRIIGMDQLHVGTAVGKMFESKKEILENSNALKEKMCNLKPVMPVASGGLNPSHIPELIEIFGKDFVAQFGGGIHFIGTKNGAKAVRQALDAVMLGNNLKEYAKTHKELFMALKKLNDY